MNKQQAIAYRRKIETAAAAQTDEAALKSIELFPKWAPDTHVNAGQRLQYGGVLYRALQSHDTQPDWTPDRVPALFTVVSVEVWPEWKQPTGASDAYNAGDKVSHVGKHWISIINGNVWEPGTPGTDALWEES